MDRGTVPIVRWTHRSATLRTAAVDLPDRTVPVTMRRSRRARRLILKVAFDSGDVVVTLPPETPWDHAVVFVTSRADWIGERLDRLPPRTLFADGSVVPVLGIDRTIRHRPDRRTGVELVGDQLLAGGDGDGLARRIERWLRRRALAEVTARSLARAALLGAKPGRISVRDVRSRWGSCSAAGNLSYSWRLVLAPEFVLDYVVAHEVAHLKVRGHGRAFWAVVTDLVGSPAAARQWLSRHGHALHRFGPPGSAARSG